MTETSTINNSFFSLKKSIKGSAHSQDLSIPWIEKYRPKTITDIASHDDIKTFFKKVLETNELPNLLFYGPPGTGKTSSVIALARDLFGAENLKSRLLELNASDERGIQVIREKVKAFAQLAVNNNLHKNNNIFNNFGGKNITAEKLNFENLAGKNFGAKKIPAENYAADILPPENLAGGESAVLKSAGKISAVENSAPKNVPAKNFPSFKLVILDEADNMTSSAQAALRRIMESTISNTRFCLICNYITKIIDPILSRCTSLYFKPLPPSQCISRLMYIRDVESLQISDENLSLIVDHCDGDLRKSVMYLQSCRYYNFNTINKNLILEICGVISDEFFNRIVTTLHQGTFEDIVQLGQDFVSDGFSLTKLLNQLLEYVMNTSNIQEAQRAEILSKFSGVDLMITDGADEYLQVLSIFSHIFYTLHQPV